VGEYATAEECLEAMRLLDGTELLGAKVFLFPLVRAVARRGRGEVVVVWGGRCVWWGGVGGWGGI
jgi:hypothetical protein